MLLVQGEVPPRRFTGRWKDFGPCYTRGIIEGNGNPPGNDMWLTYSMNKEDMWVSRVPVPIRYEVKGAVNDDFNGLETRGAVTDWNIYAPLWAPVEVADFPSSVNKSLCLKDEDPCDYARAIRVFEETDKAEITVKVYPEKQENGVLEIDVTDRFGNRPVRIRFDSDGKIKATNGSRQVDIQNYKTGEWYEIKITVNANPFGSFSLSVNGKEMLKDAALAEAVLSVERVSFRTGEYRNLPNRRTPNEVTEPPLPGADEKVPPTVFYIDDFKVK
jgi:hypothetical protein